MRLTSRGSILAAIILLQSGSMAVADDESPDEIARENTTTAAESMAESDKGVDEDGEKIWKAEARDWLNFDKHNNHRTFELPVAFAREIVEKYYKAGAEKVWMTGITELEADGVVLHISDYMVVVLPKDDAAKRAATFAVYNKVMEEAEEPALKDIGQTYIFLEGD